MKTLLIVAIAIVLVVLCIVSGFAPGSDGIVTERRLPDGTSLMVVQKYSSGDLGYEVGFYYKEPGAEWAWCYLDHEDSSWRTGRIDYNPSTDVVTIWKGSVLRGQWNRQKKEYSRPDVPGWDTPAPENYRLAPFLDHSTL